MLVLKRNEFTDKKKSSPSSARCVMKRTFMNMKEERNTSLQVLPKAEVKSDIGHSI